MWRKCQLMGMRSFLQRQRCFADFMPWTYRAKYIDSCGNQGTFTQEVTTMHLSGTADEIEMINTISWTPYVGFDGAIVGINFIGLLKVSLINSNCNSSRWTIYLCGQCLWSSNERKNMLSNRSSRGIEFL